MNRLLALLLPLVCVSASALKSGPLGKSDTTQLSTAWSASVAAETSRDYEEALKQIAAFEQAGGDKYLSALRTAWLEYLRANYVKAADAYQRANKLQPMATAPLTGNMNALYAAADYRKAATAAEALLRVEPTNYSAVMMLANMSLNSLDYRKAQTYYRRVLATYPGDLDATSGVAWSSFYLGDKVEALRNFQIIATINADYLNLQKGIELSSKAGR